MKKKGKMITVRQLCEKTGFEPANIKNPPDREIHSVYCCDLLSVVMGQAPAGCAWVTIMGNLNAVAVSALTDAACIVVAGAAAIEERALEKADAQGVLLLKSPLPIFETAKQIDRLLEQAI